MGFHLQGFRDSGLGCKNCQDLGITIRVEGLKRLRFGTPSLGSGPGLRMLQEARGQIVTAEDIVSVIFVVAGWGSVSCIAPMEAPNNSIFLKVENIPLSW